MTAARVSQTTEAEYLAGEEVAAEKHEFLDGHVYAMAGASPPHVFLAASLTHHLFGQLHPRGCFVASADLKVKNEVRGSFFYPDVVVTCQQPAYQPPESQGILLNPTAVFEVLSPSTEKYDRGTKAKVYRAIPSLHTLGFISQHEPLVEWYERSSDGGDFWTFREASGMDAVARLTLLDAELPLQALYAGIPLTPAPEPPPPDVK